MLVKIKGKENALYEKDPRLRLQESIHKEELNKIIANQYTKKLLEINIEEDNVKKIYEGIDFEKLNNMMNYRLERTNTKFSNLINKLELLNPLSVLSKGYSVTYKDDKVIKDASKLKKNDSVTIRLYNGLFEAKVEEIKK